jgi:hypothetical protein
VTNQTLTLAELAGDVEQVFEAVAEPLPELEGRVPEGWKDALYARS